MVSLSWISFWMDRYYIGERLSLGITTILTIVFLLGSSNSTMPRVSYAKAIDWYLLGSFIFVFSTLVTDLLVYRFRAKEEEKKKKREENTKVRKCIILLVGGSKVHVTVTGYPKASPNLTLKLILTLRLRLTLMSGLGLASVLAGFGLALARVTYDSDL